MRRKITFLKIAMLTLVVFCTSYVVPTSLAYWSNVQLVTQIEETVIIGEWDFVPQWDPNATYSQGDIVENNGVLYEAKRDNPTREPGVDGGWQRDWNEL